MLVLHTSTKSAILYSGDSAKKIMQAEAKAQILTMQVCFTKYNSF